MTTTTMTLTDQQITALREEAATAGDYDMAFICMRALGIPLEPVETDGGPAMGMSIADAREECARVIADAAAQA